MTRSIAGITMPVQESADAAAAGTWTAAGDLPVAAYWGSPTDGLTLLANGKVLAAGGEDGGRNAKQTAALFDPQINKWAATGSMSISRRLNTQTKLADGTVLVVGGISGQYAEPVQPVASAEIYDPATGKWTATGALHEARFAHSATLLRDGKVLVAGGIARRDAQTIKALSSAELFDPITKEWTTTTAMHDERGCHPAVALRDGKVLVVGGVMPVGRGLFAGLAFCEIFDPATTTWTSTGSLSTVRKNHQATVMKDGTVLVTGGDSQGLEDWSYNPYSQWTTERYNPATGAWAADVDMDTGRSHHRAVLLGSGKLLVIGGTDDATFDVGYQNAILYDPAARTWTATGGMVVGRWAFGATGLADGRVLAAGGMVRSGAAKPDTVDVVTATSETFTA